MRTVLAIAALAVVPALAGAGVRRQTNTAVAWAAGWIAIALTAAIAHAVRAPQGVAYAAIAVCAAGGTAFTARDGAGRASLAPPWRYLVGLLAVCTALNTVWLPVQEWDAVAIWYAKTRGLLEWRSVAALELPLYPTLGASAWALMLAISGLALEPIARLALPMLCIAAIGALPLLFDAPDRMLPRRTLVIVFLVAVATFNVGAATSGYQDQLIAAVIGIAAILLARALRDPTARSAALDVTLGCAFAGSAAMIKVEGTVAAVALVTSWVAVAWSSHGRTAIAAVVKPVAPVVLVLMVALWPAIALASGLSASNFQPGIWTDVSPARFASGLSRLPQIARAYGALGPTWYLPITAAAAASAGAWFAAPNTRSTLAWLWSFAVLHTLWNVGLFVVTNVDVAWHLRTALDRLESQHGFAWTIILAVALVSLLDPAERAPTER
jgi:hypothetical protein